MKYKVAVFMMITMLIVSGCGNGTKSSSMNEANSTETITGSSVEDSTEKNEVDRYAVGDTVSTDIVEYTLHRAEFAIALNNMHGADFMTPKEYDENQDNGNPFVAPIGKTLLSFDFTIKNTNRTSVNFCGADSTAWHPNFKVEYNGETYLLNRHNGWSFDLTETIKDFGDGAGYVMDATGNTILDAGAECKMRSVGLVNVEPKEENPAFTIILELPTSDGNTMVFAYDVK